MQTEIEQINKLIKIKIEEVHHIDNEYRKTHIYIYKGYVEDQPTETGQATLLLSDYQTGLLPRSGPLLGKGIFIWGIEVQEIHKIAYGHKTDKKYKQVSNPNGIELNTTRRLPCFICLSDTGKRPFLDTLIQKEKAIWFRLI